MNSLACTEVLELFELLGEETKCKIPNNFWQVVEQNKLKNYDKKKMQEDVWAGKMSDEGINLYAALKLKYLSEDELEKKILEEVYNYNASNKAENKKDIPKVKINNEIFSAKKEDIVNEKVKTEKVSMVEYKESFITKIINKIKNIFSRK